MLGIVDVLETFLNHDCDSSNDGWKILQQLFLDNASATQMQLRYKFQHFTKGDLSMQDYLQQLHSIYRSLIEASTKCQICGDFNHEALDCSNRFNHAFTSLKLHKSLATMHFDENGGNVWYPDSGASAHMIGDRSLLTSLTPYFETMKVMVGNGTLLPITHTGTAFLTNLILKNVLVVPSLKRNLMSIQQLCSDNDCLAEFSSSTFLIKDQKSRKPRLRCSNEGSLYPIRSSAISALSSTVVHTSSINNLRHLRLGHPSSIVLRSLGNNKLIQCKPSTNISCNVCQLGKHVKLPFSDSITRVQFPFELIYSDVWESPILSPSGMPYYVSFIDAYTKCAWVYPMKCKSDTFMYMQQFHSMITNVFKACLITFQADEGGEFHKLEPFFKQHGILYRYYCPYTPQQNGIAERKHRHIVDKMRCLLFQSMLPPTFWVEALNYSFYLINKLCSPSLNNNSPHQLLHQKTPYYDLIKVFGCLCYPNLTKHITKKYDSCSLPHIFLGVSSLHKGYSSPTIFPSNFNFQDPAAYFDVLPKLAKPHAHSLPRSFLIKPSHTSPNMCTNNPLSTQHPPTLSNPPTTTILVPTQNTSPAMSPVLSSPSSQSTTSSQLTAAPSKRSRPTSTPSHPMVTRAKTGSLKPKSILSLSALLPSSDPHYVPSCYTDASRFSHWRKAMADEYTTLMQNNTWELVPYTSTTNLIGCKWVYRVKLNLDNSISRYKARLVAQGFKQQHGLDFDQTFSPVVKPASIRTVLTIVVVNNWELRQLDVKNAFLNVSSKPRGLGSRKYLVFLLSHGFVKSSADSSLFIFKDANAIIYFLLYVDDIIVTGSSSTLLTYLISSLNATFSLNDLGQLLYV
ncbi:transmembrane signal receptor [Lithospermum erythrorhizon]|uniref:Transmembrane signal receptor n=1 Tax=Lithospermum erythrorhizon TaxID=34254 RepID=A0AAV3NX06_LITER